MSRLPPRLLYLIIYNPTLQPTDSASLDDEDAQEQAHVLFYTANDHAVSKDRVLRQVGLAKALANFTTLFDPRVSCESVHSQSRRMIMVSPEPDFWIHACFELEKIPRISKKEEKGKAKQKEPVYDYNDASLHDAALRTQLLMGYEIFKLAHGSFTSILERLSKEALELQLERFFTVWAWSWDFDKAIPFSNYLGVRVHPLSTQLTPLLDVFEDKLLPHYFPIILVSSCIVASKSMPPQCPLALIRHLLRILETRASCPRHADKAQGDVSQPEVSLTPIPANEQKHSRNSSKAFLGLNMNANMDVRKWNWPGYLTFGMGGSSSKQKTEAINQEESAREKADAEDEEKANTSDYPSQSTPETRVDSKALEDALSSNTGSQITVPVEDKESPSTDVPMDASIHVVPPDPEDPDSRGVPSLSIASPGAQDNAVAEAPSSDHLTSPNPEQASPTLLPTHSFSELRVHLSNSDPLDTHRRFIRYLCMDNILFALVPTLEREDDSLDEALCQDLAERSAELIDRLKEIVEVEQEKIASAFSSSPVQNVLQKSQHVISTPNQLTYSSPEFSATSWHLHEGKKTLGLRPDIIEIYSRGQSPQDWHLVRRGLGTNVKGEVYMEIGRKEASLVDVDNEITGVLRRFTE